MDIIRIFWEYPRSVDIICILWIYPYFMDIIRILWKYPRSVDIIHTIWKYPRSVDIIRHFVDIIHMGHITSYLVCNVYHDLRSFIKVVEIIRPYGVLNG